MNVLIRLQPPARSSNQRRPAPHERGLDGLPKEVAHRIISDSGNYLQGGDEGSPHFLYSYRKSQAGSSFEEDQDPTEEVLLALDFSDVRKIEALRSETPSKCRPARFEPERKNDK